jgi:hypothetical protein
MLSRIVSAFGKKTDVSKRRSRFRGPTAPPAVAPQLQSGQQQNKFDFQKILRTGFFVIGAGFVFSRVFLDPDNPDSVLNRSLYPKGRGRFVLKIEKWEDKISNYKTSYTTATDGIKSAIKSQGKYKMLQKLSREVNEWVFSLLFC